MKKTRSEEAALHKLAVMPNRKRKFRQAIQRFLGKCDDIGLPLGDERFASSVVFDPKNGSTNLIHWVRGRYTTGAYTFFAHFNNPRFQVCEGLDEVLCLMLVRGQGNTPAVVCQVELRCSAAGATMHTTFASSIHIGQEQTPIVFCSEQALRAALYDTLGFTSFVNVVFRPFLEQPSDDSPKGRRQFLKGRSARSTVLD